MSDGLDLDALLEESVSLATEAKKLRYAQKASHKGKPIASNGAAANVGFMNAEERAEHQADVIKFKLRAEGWIRTAVVLLQHTQICSCGSEHTHTEGVFIQKDNPRLRIKNLVKPEGAYEYDGLPKRVEIRTQRVTVCSNCRDSQGWGEAEIEII